MGYRSTKETYPYRYYVPVFGTGKIIILGIFVKLQSVNYCCMDTVWSTVIPTKVTLRSRSWTLK